MASRILRCRCAGPSVRLPAGCSLRDPTQAMLPRSARTLTQQVKMPALTETGLSEKKLARPLRTGTLPDSCRQLGRHCGRSRRRCRRSDGGKQFSAGCLDLLEAWSQLRVWCASPWSRRGRCSTEQSVGGGWWGRRAWSAAGPL